MSNLEVINLKLDTMKEEKNKVETPHGPTDHNPYHYPIQGKNRKGWLRALWALIIVAVVVTLFCVVVGVYEHHEESLQQDVPVEAVSTAVAD